MYLLEIYVYQIDKQKQTKRYQTNLKTRQISICDVHDEWGILDAVGFTVYYNGAFRSRFPTTLINVYGPEQGPDGELSWGPADNPSAGPKLKSPHGSPLLT